MANRKSNTAFCTFRKHSPRLGAKNAISVGILAACQAGSMTASAQLEEIIVTANKRSESANDIGLSITALSGDQIAEQRLSNLEDISIVVPGLTFATSQQNTPILTIRGVGFNESSLGVYPATSLYIDEIPLPFPAMASNAVYDLERMEVLKGPQGVLFGQNSTGGAINFIAAKPTEELSYGGDIGYGNFNRVELNAFASGPITDSFAARLAVQDVSADDWQESLTSADENGEQDYSAARLILQYTPTDTSTISVNVNGWRDKSDPQALQYVAATPKRFDEAPGNAQILVDLPLTANDAESADWSAKDRPSGDREFIQFSARGDFGINDTMTLTGIAAYSDYEQDQSQDGDGHNLLTAGFEHNKGEIDSTFVEIRLSGDTDTSRWVVGANYEDSSTSEAQMLNFLDNTTYRPQVLYIHRLEDTLDQDIESYAFFGNVDYDLSEAFTLKLGARYTDTTIEAESCHKASLNDPDAINTSGDLNSNVARLFNLVPAIVAGQIGTPVPEFDPIGVDDCFTLNAPPLAGGVPGEVFEDELAEDNFSWRVGLDYNFSSDTLLYANVSQGYKAGSYPVLAANDFSQLAPVTQESVLAYEVGFKASLRDSSVQWNGAIFHYDYEDKQVRGKTLVIPFGALDRLVNVPESTITGFETDIVAQLTDTLTLRAGITYLDSQVDKYPALLDGRPYAFDVYGVNRDLSGNDLPLTPELSYTLDLDYRTPLNSGGLIFAGVNVAGQTDSDAVFDADDLSLADYPAPGASPQNGLEAGFHKSITENYFVIEEYFVVGARVGYESSNGRFQAMLWGRNLTDEYYWNSVIASSEGGARVAGRPRTYGITLRYAY